MDKKKGVIRERTSHERGRVGIRISLILILSILILSIPASAEWWNSSFLYRKQININNMGTNLTYYQMNFILINGTNVNVSQSNFNDVRFLSNCTASAVLLPYWLENFTSGVNASFWVNVSSIGNASNTLLCLYYGNASVGNLSNGNATFSFYDHFEGTAFNSAVWTQRAVAGVTTVANSIAYISGDGWNVWGADKVPKADIPFIIEWYAKLAEVATIANHAEFLGASNYETGVYGDDMIWVGRGLPDGVPYFYTLNEWVQTSIARTANLTSYTNIKFVVTVGRVDYYHNGTLAGTSTTNTPDEAMGAWMGDSNTENGIWADYVFIRKYASVEPTYWFSEVAAITFLNATPANGATGQSLNTTLSVRYVNSMYNESASIAFYNNATGILLVNNTGVANNTTTSYAWEGLNYGTQYCWYVYAVTLNITQNSSVYCFTTIGGINIYKENIPTELTTGIIHVVFANATMTFERNVSSGILNFTGVPTTEKITLSFQDSTDYYARNVLLPNGLGEIDRLYLLPKTADAISTTFYISDYTGGDFSSPDTMIVGKRWISGAERYIFGGYRGVANSFGVPFCQLGATYVMSVANNIETRVVGNHYATITLAELKVGLVTYPTEIIAPGEKVLISVETGSSRYANNTFLDVWITVYYNDTELKHRWVNISIKKSDNISHIYAANDTIGNNLIVFTYHFNLADKDTYDYISKGGKFLVSANFNGSNVLWQKLVDFALALPGAVIDFAGKLGISQAYLTIFGVVIIIFVGLMFNYTFSDIGGIVVAVTGFLLWWMGVFPRNAIGYSLIILIFFIAVLNFIYVRRRGKQI